MSDFGSMVSQEVPGVWRQRVVCGGRMKKIKKKKNGQTRSTTRESFWTQTGRSQPDLAAPLQGSCKERLRDGFSFVCGLLPRPHERTEGEDDGEKLCRHPEEMQREAASAEKVTVCGDGENRGCLVLLRCL